MARKPRQGDRLLRSGVNGLYQGRRPDELGGTQNNLGLAWLNMPTGDKAENLGKAIACYEAALTVYTKAADPTNWAMTQNNLGVAWSDMPTGDKAENLRKAIASIKGRLDSVHRELINLPIRPPMTYSTTPQGIRNDGRRENQTVRRNPARRITTLTRWSFESTALGIELRAEAMAADSF